MSKTQDEVIEILRKLDQVKKSYGSDPIVLDAVASVQEWMQRKPEDYTPSNDSFSVKEIAEMFHVEVQTVHKWIKQNKIEAVPIYSPGAVKKVTEFRIPKSQFVNNSSLMAKKYNEVKAMREAQAKINTRGKNIEHFLPVSNEEDVMEELDIKRG